MESKKSFQESLSECSSKDYAEENYDWVDDENFSNSNKRDFLKYPLNEWKNFVFDKNQSNYLILEEGKLYQDIVNKILEKDFFKDFNYYKEKSEMIKTRFDNYQANVDIKPDFFVHKIKKEKFIELLEKRNYMMTLNYKIDESVKYISIIGEIKLNHNQLLKKRKRKLYFKFIKNAKIEEGEKFLLMYVYDESFNLYEEDNKNLSHEQPIIYCFIPKLYKGNCYGIFNGLSDKLNENIIKSNFGDLKEKQSKQDLEKKLKRLEKKFDRLLLLLICAVVLIISLLLKVYNH